MSDVITVQQVQDKVLALPKDHRGLFIGEEHNNSLAVEFALSSRKR